MTQREEQPIIGESPVFLEVLEEVSRVASLQRPVLLIGERGTGKELVAERLHFLSPRWGQSFIKLNCAAISETLLESELFGHEAGAFTDAARKRLGRFELADGGTLFLDELASTSMAVQEKILRVIEYGEFERLGASQTRRVNVRMIGATNEDLPTLADANRFRKDLLDRLAFDVITLPPLRARKEDILPLAEHFAIRMATELGHEFFPGFSSQARQQLLAYPWPGNVRELKNVVERATYRNPDPAEVVDVLEFDPFASPWRPVEEPSSTASPPDPTAGPLDYLATVGEFEIGLLSQALQACDQNQRRTAEHLGLSYDQLRGLLRKYKLTGGR